MKTREEAVGAAKSVRRCLSTRGWKKRVWENLGWHWTLKKGRITLDYAGGAFCVGVTSTAKKHDCGVPSEWYIQNQSNSTDPNVVVSDTVTRTIKILEAGIKTRQDILDELQAFQNNVPWDG